MGWQGAWSKVSVFVCLRIMEEDGIIWKMNEKAEMGVEKIYT